MHFRAILGHLGVTLDRFEATFFLFGVSLGQFGNTLGVFGIALGVFGVTLGYVGVALGDFSVTLDDFGVNSGQFGKVYMVTSAPPLWVGSGACVSIDFASRFPPRHLEAARLRGLETSRLFELRILTCFLARP